MKRLSVISIILLATLLFVVSCEKAEEPDLKTNPYTYPPGTGPGIGNSLFSYKVNGVPVEISALQAIKVYDTVGFNISSIIHVSGTDSLQSLELWLNSDSTSGTHNLDYSPPNLFYMFYEPFGITFGSSYWAEHSALGPCKVTITNHDKVANFIEGTFYGTLAEFNNLDTIQITEGKFNVQYKE